MPANHTLGSTELRWRFPGQFLENAIELRQRLKSRGERDFTDAQIAVIVEDLHAFSNRVRATYSTKFMPVTCLNFSLR